VVARRSSGITCRRVHVELTRLLGGRGVKVVEIQIATASLAGSSVNFHLEVHCEGENKRAERECGCDLMELAAAALVVRGWFEEGGTGLAAGN